MTQFNLANQTVALDWGTTSIKASLDVSGRHSETPFSMSAVGATADDVAMYARVLPTNDEPTNIAITGQMHGLITMEGGEMQPLISWQDDRSRPLMADLRNRLGPDYPLRTGAQIEPGFMAATLAWIRQCDPARWNRIERVFTPCSAVSWAMIGNHTIQPSDAAGTGLYDTRLCAWDQPTLDAIGIPESWLPTVEPTFGPAVSDPTQLVFQVGGDAPVAAFGVGAVRDGDMAIMLGTGAQVMVARNEFLPDPTGTNRWLAWPAASTSSADTAPYLQIGRMLHCGDTILRGYETLGPSKMDPTAPSGVHVSLPDLIAGDPGDRRPFSGNRLTARRGNQAILEAIGYQILDLLETIGRKDDVATLTICGGALKRPYAADLLANVLGRPLRTYEQPDASTWGAITCLTGQRPPHVRLIEPDPVAHSLFCEHRQAANSA